MKKSLMLTISAIWVKETKWRCGYSIECCINVCAMLMLVKRDRNLIIYSYACYFDLKKKLPMDANAY